MPRQPRCLPPGFVYHALNRTVARACLFEKPADYDAFERVLLQASDKHPIRILSYCLIPNHWHFVLWPERQGQMTEFLRWLTHTHTQRWHAHYHSAGTGHLSQGRFKAFPVEEDEHLYAVLRYTERNALRAGLVSRAEDWRWGSLTHRRAGDALGEKLLSPWPLPRDEDLLRIQARKDRHSELVDGVLVEKVTGLRGSFLGGLLCRLLGHHAPADAVRFAG